MAKRIGRAHDLALALWATGNADARLLACMVADPSRMTEGDLDAWIGGISYIEKSVAYRQAQAARKAAREAAKKAGWAAAAQ